MGLPDIFTVKYTSEMIDEWLGIKKDNNPLILKQKDNKNDTTNNNSKNSKEIEQ